MLPANETCRPSGANESLGEWFSGPYGPGYWLSARPGLGMSMAAGGHGTRTVGAEFGAG